MNKYNKELIEKLRNREIALKYDNKSLEDLRAILKEAFPKDNAHSNGTSKYYYAGNNFPIYWCSTYNEVENREIISIKDFIQEEFVFPEKWCILRNEENYETVNKWFNNGLKNISNYTDKDWCVHYPNYGDFKGFKKGFHLSSTIKENYTEITFEQFQKYVLNKQDNNMENKEIIGYKAPYDLYNGNIKKGDLVTNLKDRYVNNTRFKEFEYGVINKTDFWLVPKEIVETWEPVYKSKEQVFNMGSFEVVVKDGKAFHKNDDITTFVKDLVGFYNGQVKSFGTYSAVLQDVIFSKTGCQNVQTKLSDWQKVYNALNQ